MPRKKTTKADDGKDVTALGFFECQNVINEITAMAETGEGELTDEQVNALTEAHTQTPIALKSYINFLKLMEHKISLCKDRKKEINDSQKRAETLIGKLEARLAEWVEAQGKSYHCDTYELKSRKSTKVVLVEGFNHPFYCSRKTVTTITPDRAAIKKALEAGEDVPGATLDVSQNLTIK